MGQEIVFGLGAIVLLTAIVLGVMRSGRLRREEKAGGDAVTRQRYKQNEG